MAMVKRKNGGGLPLFSAEMRSEHRGCDVFICAARVLAR